MDTGSFPQYNIKGFEERIGMNPGYPVLQTANQTTTIMGGWGLAIPETSQKKIWLGN